MMHSTLSFTARFFALLLVLSVTAGCGDKQVTHQDPHHDHNHDNSHHHHHQPPHGGVPVVLGNEEFHIEFLIDNAQQYAIAYIFDGHLDNFVRIEAPSFDLTITSLPDPVTITFLAQESNATGESIGKSATFKASHPTLKSLTQFKATIPSITILNKTYSNITFPFPQGNE